MKNENCDRKSNCYDYKYNHCDGCGANKPIGDLISRSEAEKLGATCLARRNENGQLEAIISLDNAPTVKTYCYFCGQTEHGQIEERPQGEYETACNVLLSLEQIVRKSDGWEDSAVEAVHNAIQTAIKCMHERPQGEWKRHDEWVGGEYIGGFYHVNCPCDDGYYSKWETNFCPNCGLPMKKGGAE